MSNPPDDDDLIPFDRDPDAAVVPAVAPDGVAVPDDVGSPEHLTADPATDGRECHADDLGPTDGGMLSDGGDGALADGGTSGGGMRPDGGTSDGDALPRGVPSDGGAPDGGALADGGTSGGGMRPDSGTSGGGASDGGVSGTDPGDSLGGGDLTSAAAGGYASATDGSAAGAGDGDVAKGGSAAEVGTDGEAKGESSAEDAFGADPAQLGRQRLAVPADEARDAPSVGAKGGGASRSEATGGSGRGAGRRGRRAALRKAALLGLVVTASIAAIGAGAYGVLKPYLAPDDFKGTGSGSVTVRIPPGANAGDIGAVLADAGVVASARSFVNVTKERAVAGRLHPGHYRLRKGMAAGAALDLLLAPASKVIRRVTVPEGMRAGETLVRVAAQSGLALKELQAVDTALVGLPKYARGLEGFLFPATYEVEPGDKAVDLLAAMVERFRAAARKVKLVEKAARVHLTPLEAVTVASMVQAEGGRDEDYPKISRVIYNRLQRGTPLQIDSTVLYAQGKRTAKVTESDTKVRSPYNTYAHTGLPPGPIANPGEKALIATLHPAKGDWHWFVTTDPAHRITKFTNKESEFVRYREELNRNLRTK
ncbi:endolytic transglycosylase MltG [Nonomuraea sp. NPDC049141]|uniref:endolytic transglycosylase MltG n=1 Tax=unclassified Nonomuraea TaxID=2593643 RepID=UPI0033C80D32